MTSSWVLGVDHSPVYAYSATRGRRHSGSQKARRGCGALYQKRQQDRERLGEQREQIIQMKMEGLLTSEEFLMQKTRIMDVCRNSAWNPKAIRSMKVK